MFCKLPSSSNHFDEYLALPGEEGSGGGKAVEAKLGADLAPDQEVGQVQDQRGLVPVLRGHQVPDLVMDRDDEPALDPHLLEKPLHRDKQQVEEVHCRALNNPVYPEHNIIRIEREVLFTLRSGSSSRIIDCPGLL